MKSILIIDDEPEFLSMLKLRLMKTGFEIHEAANGHEGLELLKGGLNPDLIITDEMMPVMDGYRLVKTVKEDKRFSRIPIIILTAKETMKEAFEFVDVDCFMSKPFDPQELIDQIRSLLEKTD